MDGWSRTDAGSRTGSGGGERCALAEFTAEQQERLTRVLDEYLVQLERGAEPNREALIAQHPDLAEQIVRYLESLRMLQGAANRFHPAPGDEITPTRRPERIGNYRITREIGRGGMAIVYEAEDESLGRTVALKVLPFWAVNSRQQIARFRNEAHSLAQMQHPNIVPVYATGEESGVHYFAMRLIEGLPLDRVIRGLRQRSGDEPAHPAEFSESTETFILPPGGPSVDGGTWPLGPALTDAPAVERLSEHPVLSFFPREHAARFDVIARLVGQVAHALHAAHEYGIVHRDVKPSNLLIDADATAWVADFGLARNAAASQVTGTGDLVGTLRYMSPEQVRGDAPFVDHRSDIYSLGITLYELVTLQPAYGTLESGPRLLDRMEQHDFARPRSLVPEVPPDLENIILKATAKPREERYDTAAEFADDLLRFVAGEPTLARRPTAFEQMLRWLKRRKRMAASLAAMALVLLLASMVSACLIYREKLATETALESSLRNFRMARSVVDHLGAQFAEDLASVPGTEEIRRSLLMETIDYYGDLIEHSARDDGLEVDLATALNKMALLTEHVGTLEEALVVHRQALAAFQKLAEDQPHVTEHLVKAALCENNIALLLTRQDRLEEAERIFLDAIGVQRQLIARTNSTQLRRDLGLSLNNYGLLLCEAGRPDEAARAFEEAISQCSSDAQDLAADPLAWRYLAAAYANLAELRSEGNPDAAIEAYEESLRILGLLEEEAPYSPHYQRDLALTWNNLAALYSRLGSHPDAARAYAAALTIHRKLLDAAPHHPDYRRDMAVCENNVALALARAGRHDDAERHFRQAIAIQQQLTLEFPDELLDAGSLGGIWNNLGMVLEQQEQPREAIDAYRKAVLALKGVVAEAPDEQQHRRYLGRAYFNIVRVLREQGKLDKALDYLLESRDLWRQDPAHLLTVAEELALVAEASKDPEGPAAEAAAGTSGSKRSIADCLVETIRMALEAGLDRATLDASKRLGPWLKDIAPLEKHEAGAKEKQRET